MPKQPKKKLNQSQDGQSPSQVPLPSSVKPSLKRETMKRKVDTQDEDSKTLTQLKASFDKLGSKEEQFNAFFNFVSQFIYNHISKSIKNDEISNFTEDIMEYISKAFQICAIEQKCTDGKPAFPPNFASHWAFWMQLRKKNPHSKTGRRYNNIVMTSRKLSASGETLETVQSPEPDQETSPKTGEMYYNAAVASPSQYEGESIFADYV
jgi:hypothetical protein